MPAPSFALVRIDRSARLLALVVAVSGIALAATLSSRAQDTGSPADPHQHHSAPAPAPDAPPAVGTPSRSTTVNTPSWFPGGEALYVPPYYDSFKGLDLTTLTAAQKERFLHKVNTEFCSCNQTGCRRDTIAHCYVTDAACPRAPVRIREMLEKVKSEGNGDAPPPGPTVTITPAPGH